MVELRVATELVLQEIQDERLRQERSHGRTPEEDDLHSLHEWAWLVAHRAHGLSCPYPDEYLPDPDPRRALVEIAAVAVAAVESWDRRHARS